MLYSYLTKIHNPALKPTVSAPFRQAKAAAELVHYATPWTAYVHVFLNHQLTLFNADSGIHDSTALSFRQGEDWIQI